MSPIESIYLSDCTVEVVMSGGLSESAACTFDTAQLALAYAERVSTHYGVEVTVLDQAA